MSQGFINKIPLPLPVTKGGTGTMIATGTGSVVLNNAPNIIGVTDGSNALAGSLGEVISSVVTTAGKVTLTSTVMANITSISLTAGDWDISWSLSFETASTTSFTRMRGGVNTLSAVMPASSPATSNIIYQVPAYVPGVTTLIFDGATCRQNLSSTTTIYLNADSQFTINNMFAYGWIFARRMR